MARATRVSVRALTRLPLGLVRVTLVVRVVDEWWSYLPAGAIGDLRRDLGVSYAQAGWLLALITVGGFVGGPLGALADCGHRRLLATTGAGLIAVGLVVYATGAPFVALAAASMVLGAASDLMIRPLETSLAELAGDQLDTLLGRQHLVTWFGDLIGPALLALGATTWLGWRGAFGFSAAMVASYGVALALIEYPPVAEPDLDEPPLWREALRLGRTRVVLLLAGAELIMIPLDEAFLGFAVARLTAEGRGPSAQSLAGALFVGGVVGSSLVSRRGLAGRRNVGAVSALAAGALTAAAVPWLGLQLVGMTALGYGTAVTWTVVHHRTLTAVPGRSSTVATVVSMLSTPALLVPVAIGWLADRTSLTVGLVVTALLAVALAVFVLALRDDQGEQAA
jgi:MFS family permease